MASYEFTLTHSSEFSMPYNWLCKRSTHPTLSNKYLGEFNALKIENLIIRWFSFFAHRQVMRRPFKLTTLSSALYDNHTRLVELGIDHSHLALIQLHLTIGFRKLRCPNNGTRWIRWFPFINKDCMGRSFESSTSTPLPGPHPY